jgi:alpha-ketoglutarate-dependent 2,4-dichlorophenoxyacetate dioxygenase
VAATQKLTIRPLHRLFGAEVTTALTDCAPTDVDATASRYGLLLFRDLGFDDAALVAFAAQFGRLQQSRSLAGTRPEITRLTNLDPDGGFRAPDDGARSLSQANGLWHVDNSFTAPGVTYSFLHARVVPGEGGETEFCDNRATWEALDPDRRAVLAPLWAEHSFHHSCRQIGFDFAAYSGAERPAVRRKLVRRHAPSGRDAIVLASHIERVEGYDYKAGQALVADLTAIAAAPDRIYSHRWRADDLLVWDNRCMMHRGRPWAEDQARDLRSTRVVEEDCEGLIPAERPAG